MNAKKKMKNENDVAGSICATKWKERKGKKKKESRFEDVSQSHHVRDILHKYA